MNKVIAIVFHQLPFPAHCNFFDKVSVLITQSGQPVKTVLVPFMPDFNSWLAKEHAVLNWVRKSELTKEIAEISTRMDHILGGLNAAVTANLNSSAYAVQSAAVRVHIMLKNFGNVAHKPYAAKLGDVQAILNQFATNYSEDVLTLGLIDWIDDLTINFNGFNTLFEQRQEQQILKPDINSKQVRKGIEDVYDKIVTVIDSSSLLGTSPDFDAFIERLNFNIEFFNTEFHHAKKDLGAGDHTVIEEIANQTYTGLPISVIPNAWYREGDKPTERLVFAKDFTVTYKNNTEVGTAELTLHGKGKYKGSKTTTFNIART
jgi:hypothetical protein